MFGLKVQDTLIQTHVLNSRPLCEGETKITTASLLVSSYMNHVHLSLDIAQVEEQIRSARVMLKCNYIDLTEHSSCVVNSRAH